MTKTTVFQSGNSQAVRIPKDMALPDHIKKIDIIAVGDTRIIGPSEDTWKYVFTALDQLQQDGDLIPDREPQPKDQEREEMF